LGRTWPFERLAEPAEPFHTPEDFVARRGAGVKGVVVRIGLCDAQLVLVDPEGLWERWVYRSTEEATAVVRALEIPHHVGEFPDEIRQAMNERVRTLQDLTAGAYPEQGRVGPVIPYPENRPRRDEEEEREPASAGPQQQEGRPGPHAGVS
jgi:hypothetical protein